MIKCTCDTCGCFSAKKNKFSFAFCSLIRTFELRSKVLSFENAKKNKFSFAFCSLIRTFAPDMQKKKKILFLHGFYASGQCVPALALMEAFKGRATVLTPDLPLHPAEAIRLIRDICDKEKPDVLVGNSCGAFYAQIISPIVGIPALLGNPHFKMSDFLRERIGSHQYKSPRADGRQDFTIDEQLVKEFEEMEAHQFMDKPSGLDRRDCRNIYNKVRVWGLFGEEDTLAHFEPLFLEHYTHSFHFPGGHTPTAEQFMTWYVPLIEKLLK